MANMEAAARIDPPRAHWGYKLLLAYFVGLKIWFDLAVAPMGDESYYWMWGQFPALSYFDHPPLHAWLLGIVSKLLGWHPLSLRALTWLCLGGSLWLFWLWAKRLSPHDPQGWFWPSAAIYLATPVFFLMTTMVFHDYLMVFLCFLAFHFFLDFVDSWEAGSSRVRSLYLGALFLGLATLTKYNAGLLGFGFALLILVRPGLRGLLANPHLYVAALLSVALQAPVIAWNLSHSMASFGFHMGTRLTGSLTHLHYLHPLDFIANMAGLVLGPFLFIALFRMIKDRSATIFEARARALGLAIFATSTVAMLALSLFVYVYFYWNIVGYLALMAVALRYLGRKWLMGLHMGFGVVMALLLTANFTVLPVAFAVGAQDSGTQANYGWEEVTEAVAVERRALPQAFLGATRYTYAAQLGFQLHETEIMPLNSLPDQYDFWLDEADYAGRDAIMLADAAFPIGFAKRQFASCEKLRYIPVSRFGRLVWTFELHHCRGFVPATRSP
jgi:4-amino-4-deoxy-L-arabinose transferase-like glycosyltransferase